MKFSEFSRLWLHENYYKNAVRIGREGDFYTAVSVGELFGTLLARHFLALVDGGFLKLPLQVLEIGANEGHLSRDFLSALVLLRPSIFKDMEFYIIEPHESLQRVQKKTLRGVEFSHETSLKNCHFKNAFIFCNELFDSFACELIEGDRMAFVEDFRLIFRPQDERTKERCGGLDLQKGEWSPFLEEFFSDLDASCEKFIFAGFDYGGVSPQRFSLRIYQNHELFSPFEVDLREFFGRSDLTYDVNFAHIFALCERHGFRLLEFKRQNRALLDFGLEEALNFAQKSKKNYEKSLSQAKNLLFSFNDKFHFFEFQKSN